MPATAAVMAPPTTACDQTNPEAQSAGLGHSPEGGHEYSHCDGASPAAHPTTPTSATANPARAMSRNLTTRTIRVGERARLAVEEVP
jgi:hypothetical protein